jgi:hypothetical protein
LLVTYEQLTGASHLDLCHSQKPAAAAIGTANLLLLAPLSPWKKNAIFFKATALVRWLKHLAALRALGNPLH